STYSGIRTIILSLMGLLFKASAIFLIMYIIRPLQFSMRQHSRYKGEESAVFVFFDKFQRFFLNELRCRRGFMRKPVTIEYNLAIVGPQVRRIVSVRLPLAIVAKKLVKPFLVRRARGAHHTQSPLAKGTGAI